MLLVVTSSRLSSDLNYLEERAGGPDLTVATLPKSGKIVLLQVLAYRACITNYMYMYMCI